MTEEKSKEGLENVVVAESAISTIDGLKGELRYRGYSISELAQQSDFTEVAWLLWTGELPTHAEYEELDRKLKSARALPPELSFLVQGLASRTEPMAALRTIVSAMSASDSSPANDAKSAFAAAIRMTALLPTAIAAYARARAGKSMVDPDSELDHAANFLFMLRGERPQQKEGQILDSCLVLHAEHGFNASTFSARVTASTLSDIYSAVTSAVGTLKGPLHGGANTAVMQMLLEIGSKDKVEAYLDTAFREKRRIMGFGHRVYKVDDPRGTILKEHCHELAQMKDETLWAELSDAVASALKKRKDLILNVDFYSAATYYYLGIEPDCYTCIFAIARMPGWTAHVLEQYANNRLIRPRSKAVGPGPRAFVARDDRG